MTDSNHHDQADAAVGSESSSPAEIRAEIEQTREELGDTVEALAAKTDIKGQAQDRIAAAKQTVADNVTHANETITGKKDEYTAKAKEATPESAGAGAQQVRSTIQENPLAFATAGGFVAGLLLGWLLAAVDHGGNLTSTGRESAA